MRQALLFILVAPRLPFALRVGSHQASDHVLMAFQSYVHSYGRSYASAEEYQMRMEIFQRRMREVELQNSKPHRLWHAAMNELSDRTEAEIAQLSGWSGYVLPELRAGRAGQSASRQGADAKQPLPKEFLNWTMLAASKQITTQGQCGSCWALASAKLLQFHNEIHRPKRHRSFSAEEILACVPNPVHCGGAGGCKGATPELAFDWIGKHGLSTEEVSPYIGTAGACPKHIGGGSTALIQSRRRLREAMDKLFAPGAHVLPKDSPARAFGMVGWVRLPSNKQEPILRTLVEQGPVAVSVDSTSWHHYAGGLFDDCRDSTTLKHAAVLVGYGEDKYHKLPYWRFQNTWGKTWGEGGHIRIHVADDDEVRCGIDEMPELGIGCEGGPKEVEVCGSCGILYDAVAPIFG